LLYCPKKIALLSKANLFPAIAKLFGQLSAAKTKKQHFSIYQTKKK